VPSDEHWDGAWKEIERFIGEHCRECHSGETPSGAFSLDRLSAPGAVDHQSKMVESEYANWVRVYDQLVQGKMPPADAAQPDETPRNSVLGKLRQTLTQHNQAVQQQYGRVQYRRLNRFEYENTLRDLLELPNLEVKDMLPADGQSHGFDNVGSALNLSYVQLSRYLEAANVAIEEAIVLGPVPVRSTTHLVAIDNGRFSQVARKMKEAVPIGDAVGLLRQPNSAQAQWWWSKFEPAADGIYRMRIKTFGFYWDRGQILPADRAHVATMQAFLGSSRLPLVSFDVPSSAELATVFEFTTYLRRGMQPAISFETLDDRNKPERLDMSEYSAPGVAVEWLEIEGPLTDQWPPASYRALFEDLPNEMWTADSGVLAPPTPIITTGSGKRARREPANPKRVALYHVIPHNPLVDARRLLEQFAERAFRRPMAADDLVDVLSLVNERLEQKYSFQEAMRIGFQAILCSPEFLFFDEAPGRLGPHALASRLSYFLWSSLPDEQLLQLAASGEICQDEVLSLQVDRMLSDSRAQRFVHNFTGQWLDLRRLTITEPDEILYPEFDRHLLDSMKWETEAFFQQMVDHDLGARYVADSDFVMVNARLAELYGLENVEGVDIRRFALPEDSPRGGLLTQASILKVTANGTSTSPVTRGAWVLDRFLGMPVPPPPPNVPAVEPDLRGATTIREQLDKHRSDVACSVCHQQIDPPGFALESFDVIGGWRERYRSLEGGDEVEQTLKNGRPVRYKLGRSVDASGVAPSGEAFEDIHEFRELLLAQEEQIARNLVEQLVVYATGCEIQFADRVIVEQIVENVRPVHFGVRSIIQEIVQSDLFRSK
jgi:PAS domain-containing protein